jgi:hypothetical protein
MKYQLIVHPQSSANAGSLQLHYDIQQTADDRFRLLVEAKGDVHQFQWSDQVESVETAPQRKSELWKSTCFEVFVSPQGHTDYLEWNFSPSGNWNYYFFDSYRNLIKDPEALLAPKVKNMSPDFRWEIVATIPKAWKGREVDLGLTAVVLTQSGSATYWALTHLRDNPDFHTRDSFIAKLSTHF